MTLWQRAAVGLCVLTAGASAARGAPDQTGKAVAAIERADDPAAAIARLEASVPAARPSDVQSIDAIMVAIYAAISGPAGHRDWSRLRSLLLPAARLTASFVDEKGHSTVRQWNVDQFIAEADPTFVANPFYEGALVNRVQRYGNMAQVFTSYASRSAPNGKPFQKGVNSMQLLYDGKRWWVVSILWDIERPGNPLPRDMTGR